MSKQHHIAAIDAGFGQIKFTTVDKHDWRISDNFLQGRATGRMPSSAVSWSPALQDGNLNTADVVAVTLPQRMGGGKFFVGPEVANMQISDGQRGTDEAYYRSRSYNALYLGALAYAGYTNDSRIDLLVVGLPPGPDAFGDKDLKDDLARRLTGELEVPVPRSKRTVKLDIGHVKVLPQGHGALQLLRMCHPPYGSAHKRYLTLDSGYGTFIAYASVGVQPNLDRCNYEMGGANQLLRMVADRLNHRLGGSISFRKELDDGLRQGRRSFQFQGRPYDITPEIEHYWHEQAEQYLVSVLEKVGKKIEYDTVGLTGGSCYLYEPVVRKHFDNVIVQRDALGFAQVLGYWIFGEQFMRQKGA